MIADDGLFSVTGKMTTYIDDPAFWAENGHKSPISELELELYALWRGLPRWSLSRWRLSRRLRRARDFRRAVHRAFDGAPHKPHIARARGGKTEITGERGPFVLVPMVIVDSMYCERHDCEAWVESPPR